MINIATIILIYIGAVQVNIGTIQQGDVVALYNYMLQMIIELIKLASLIITINKSIACANRVEQILLIPEGMDISGADSGFSNRNMAP
jgi:ATP-binding cassette subfamily B multidrug efflux pump